MMHIAQKYEHKRVLSAKMSTESGSAKRNSIADRKQTKKKQTIKLNERVMKKNTRQTQFSP